MGQKKKYGTAAALRKGIDGYLNSIRYEVPAVISTPTGEVDEEGRIKYATKLLHENFDGTGKPKTVVKYLTPPSVPGLLLYLGIRSKSTWSAYRNDKKLGPVVEYWDMVYEAYLAEQLEKGKHISGVMFNLEHNFQWQHRSKTELTGDGMKVTFEGAVKDWAE